MTTCKVNRFKGFGTAPPNKVKKKQKESLVAISSKQKEIIEISRWRVWSIEGSSQAKEKDIKPEFTTQDYYAGSKSDGTVWINPNESEEARQAFDKLSVAEKKLRSLIEKCYPGLDSNDKAFKLYQWNVEWWSVFNSIERRKFLFKNPNLVAWEVVFKRGTGR